MSDDSNLSMADATGSETQNQEGLNNIGIRTASDVLNRTPIINGINDDHTRNATRQRNILEPIDRQLINAKKFTRFTEINLKALSEDGAVANRKGFLDLQLLRVIANGRSKNQNQLKYYKAKDTS